MSLQVRYMYYILPNVLPQPNNVPWNGYVHSSHKEIYCFQIYKKINVIGHCIIT